MSFEITPTIGLLRNLKGRIERGETAEQAIISLCDELSETLSNIDSANEGGKKTSLLSGDRIFKGDFTANG